jgi:hypothetical protein
MTTPSLRPLWVLYKRTAIANGTGGSDKVASQSVQAQWR